MKGTGRQSDLKLLRKLETLAYAWPTAQISHTDHAPPAFSEFKERVNYECCTSSLRENGPARTAIFRLCSRLVTIPTKNSRGGSLLPDLG